MVGGLAVSLLLLVFLFISASQGEGYRTDGPGAWAIVAMVALSLAYLSAGAAYGLSFHNRTWLLAITGFGAMQIILVCFHIFPLSAAAKGMDFLWLMAGTLLVLGAELTRQGVVMPSAFGSNSIQRTPESRLKQLKQLHEGGLLGDSEYAEARKQVLSSMQDSIVV